MPTIEQGHRNPRRLPRSITVRANQDNVTEFKIIQKYERKNAIRFLTVCTIGFICFAMLSAGVIVATVYVAIEVIPNLIMSIGLFCLWFIWLLSFLFVLYGLVHCLIYTHQYGKYGREKRRSEGKLSVVAQTTTAITSSNAPLHMIKDPTTIMYSDNLKKHVNSMAGVFLGRQNSEEFRHIIISGNGLGPSVEVPVVIVQANNDSNTLVYNVNMKQDLTDSPIEIVIEGTSTTRNQPQIMEEPHVIMEEPKIIYSQDSL
jgi:hypothetical protein